MSDRRRGLIATTGAFVYLLIAIVYLFGTEDYYEPLLQSRFFRLYAAIFVSLAFFLLFVPAYFLGRLVAFKDEKAGPVRAFLGGVALPAIVAVIARTSLWIF